MSFRERQAWDTLRANPGLSRKELATMLGGSLQAMSDTLRRLRRRGCVVLGGTVRGSVCLGRWHATEKEPSDLRGCSVGSQKALAAGQLPWAEALKMADRARLKRKVKPPKTVVFSTELERRWRNVGVLRQIRQEDD